MPCPKCGSLDFYEKPRPDTPHNAAIYCEVCNEFIKWKPKDKNKDKRPPNRLSPEDISIRYCELCLRQKTRLGTHETLEIHHKIEINDGGQDIKENILVVCTHCHKLIHHVRTYMNDHFGDFWIEYERMKEAIEKQQLSPGEYESEIIENLESLEKPPWEE